jgi:hypothetical protein
MFNGPSWSWPLPLSHGEMRNAINSNDPRQMLVGCFANSLRQSNYDFRRHPAFADYCSGLLASPKCPLQDHHQRELEGLIAPRPLPGFDDHTLCWYSPEQLDAVVRQRRVEAKRKAELKAEQEMAELKAACARAGIEVEQIGSGLNSRLRPL